MRLSTTSKLAKAPYFLAPFIAEFSQKYPQITIDININNRRVDLIAEGFDLVVRVGKLDDSSLISKRIASTEGKLFASQRYIDQFGIPKNAQVLMIHKTLAMSDQNNSHTWLFENTEGEVESVVISPNIVINDFTMLLKVCAGGEGIALLPEYIAQEALDKQQIVSILPALKTPVINYYVLYPSHRGLTRKSRLWIEFIESMVNLKCALHCND